eukprot:13312006-Ditylum_brightwellii.AAC.1
MENYYKEEENTVYSFSRDKWKKYNTVIGTRRTIEVDEDGETTQLKQYLIPLTYLQPQGQLQYLTGTLPSTLLFRAKMPPAQTFQEHISQLPKWQHVLLE